VSEPPPGKGTERHGRPQRRDRERSFDIESLLHISTCEVAPDGTYVTDRAEI
jgi:hypothetical protein